MLGKIKENKILKTIYNIIYFLLVILVIIILIIVILQRVSNNSIALGGIRIFNIISGSMMPKYEVGDILISKSIDINKIDIGDDIVYQGTQGAFAGKVVTHQVIDIEEENKKLKFHTKGLANQDEDPIVSQEQIYGVIIYKIHTLSFISKIINNLYSFYFVIFIPLVILIFIEIRKIILSFKDKKQDKNT